MQGKNRRPNKVSIAITLLWITIAIGVIRSIMEFSNLLEVAIARGFGPKFVIFTTFFALAIVAFLIFMIGMGKNWARITFLVLFIVGIPFTVLPLSKSLLTNLFSGVLGIGQIILQIIALIFLFQKPSSDWFKSMKKRSTRPSP